MTEIWALAVKDLRLLVRDKAGLFFTFFFPVLYAIFFGTIFGGGGDDGGGTATPIIVVDLDGSEASRGFAASLDADPMLAVTPMDDRAAAQEAVRKGDKSAFVVIPEGFGSASLFRGEPMKLLVGVDPSRQAEGGLIQGLITAKAYERLQDSFMNADSARQMTRDAMDSLAEADDLNPIQKGILGAFLGSLETFLEQAPDAGMIGGGVGDGDGEGGGGDASGGFNPIEIETVELLADESGAGPNAYAISFPQGIIWGIMGCASGFGISLVTERNRGTLTRLRTAPLGNGRVLLGKGLACFLTTVGVAALLLAIAMLGFGVRPGSFPLLIAAVFSIAVCFVGVMMMLSTVGKTDAAAAGIGWAVMLVFAMFGGAMIPLFLMQGWMVTLSHASPVKWSILAMEGAIWRGFTPAEMLLPCGILLAVGVAGFGVGARLFDWNEH